MPDHRSRVALQVLDGVLRLKRSRSLEALNTEAKHLFENMSLPKFAVARFFDARRAGSVAVLAGAFDPRWAQRYVARDYWRHSVIARELLRSAEPYSWDEAIERRGADEAQRRIRDEARELGLSDGLFTPIRWSDGSYAAVVLAGPAPNLKNPLLRASAEILSCYYGSEARRLLRTPTAVVALTRRERECLCWVREGKSSSEIGDILTLSCFTVDEHVKNACAKLGVRTRLQAVVAASLDGLLDPLL